MQTFRTVNLNAINEMALRFGWRTPAAKPVQPLNTLPWGRVLGRRTTVIRNGVEIPTTKFYAMFNMANGVHQRGATFGGVLESYEQEALALGLEGKYSIRTRAYWGSYAPTILIVKFGFDPVTGVWGLSGKEYRLPTNATMDRGCQIVATSVGIGKIAEILSSKGISRYSSNMPHVAAEIFASIDAVLREMEG